MRAKQLGGEMKYLSYGEINAQNRGHSRCSTETWRAWEYWAKKAGVGHLLTRLKKMTGSLLTRRWERTGFEPLVPPFGTDALCLPPHARMFPRVADRLRVSSQRPACRGKPDSDLG